MGEGSRVKRWLSIRLYNLDGEWIWADWAGWGPGIYAHWYQALWAAMRS